MITKSEFIAKFTSSFHDPIIRKSVKLFFLIMLLYIFILICKWNEIPLQIPLYYSLPKSPEMLGAKIQILTLPVYSLIFFMINYLISVFLYEKEKIAAIILDIAATGFAFLAFITFIKIVFLVT